MMTALAVVALVLAGLVAGTMTVGLVAIRPAMHSLPVASYITVKQAFDASYPRFMVPLQLAALVTSLALTVTAAVDDSTTSAALAGVGFVLLLVNVVVTVRGDLPINIAMASWRPEEPPADWERHRVRWDRFNAIRTAAAVTGLVLLAAAATGV
ncbi:hypothetical protein BCD49_07925 [Pseudofrankia sp. EUN1h]|nr:hypothetical protein BCD49_07925 [Pseudofrankia sp. EUN1h]